MGQNCPRIVFKQVFESGLILIFHETIGRTMKTLFWFTTIQQSIFAIFLCRNALCDKTIKSDSSKMSNPLTVEQ